jgi:hypothetical protein
MVLEWKLMTMLVWLSSLQLLHSHHVHVTLLLVILMQLTSMGVDLVLLPPSYLFLLLLMLIHHLVLVGSLHPAVIAGPLRFPPALL